jgi:hypothetical protein
MLRLIHNQTLNSPLLVDDIDDGLPNKQVHRLGSTADPKAYDRDGYANYPKQPCYVPLTKPTNPLIQGYLDLRQTERVNFSAGKGKIKKLSDAGFISVVSFTMADVAAPTITNAQLGVPGAGDVTITGTNLESLTPNTSTVLVTGTGGPLTLTQTAIIAGGGSVGNTSIVIPAALVPGVVAATTFVRVIADDQLSNTFALV